MLVLSDQYWWATDLTEDVRQELLSRGEGTRIEFGLVGFPTSPDVLIDVIENSRAGTTLLSPLLSQYGAQLARKNADLRVVVFGLGQRNPGRIENLYSIGTDRTDAFAQAGALCKGFLDDPDNATYRVAALFYSGGDRRSAEREAFLVGLGEQARDRLILKSFPRLDAVAEVNEAVSGLKDDEIGLIFVSMSSMTSDVVAQVRTQLRSLVIAEWAGQASEAVDSDLIIASIEDRWLDAVDGSLKSVESDIIVETMLVPGPAGESLKWFVGFGE